MRKVLTKWLNSLKLPFSSLQRAMIVSVVVLSGVIFLACSIGEFDVQWTKIFQPNSIDADVFFGIRLPRVLLVCVVGGGLALCGAVLQGLFRNPLADPGLIGISSGASLGAALAIVGAQCAEMALSNWLGGHNAWLITAVHTALVPLFAFFGGLLVTVIVYQLSQQNGQTNMAILLLAGVALQAICGAGLSFLLTVSDAEQLRTITFWAMGSFNASEWRVLIVTAVVTVPTALILLRKHHGLNALMLSEQDAYFLGHNIERLKKQIIVCCALMVGVMVAATGLIGFVGLLVPHMVRLVIGANHKSLLPLSLMMGMILLLLADTLARTIIVPAELPIGIITALAGGPVFIYLLIAQRQKSVLL